MLIINRPRQGGKTTELLNMLKSDENLYFVAASYQARDHVRRMAEELGVSHSRIITVNEILHGRGPWFSYEQAKLVVDELPEVLTRLLHGPVVAVTGSDFELEPEA